MKVFLIDIRNNSNEEEYKLCYEIIHDYFNKHNIEIFVFDKNIFDVHPSWTKLKCFNFIDDDFILCWDLDLLPKKNCPSIIDYLNFDKINLAPETGLIFNYPTFIDGENFKKEHFRYNCGLWGIPRKYRKDLENIFDTYSKTSHWPSWEQYHINKYLFQNDWKDVHELDKSWNCMFHVPGIKNSYIVDSKTVHITGINVNGNVGKNSDLNGKIRKDLIKMYHKLYFS